jgi:hypothetical protein
MALTKVTSSMQHSAGITFADYGATGVGDETAIIQAALTYASTNNIPIVDHSGKTYTYSTTLDVGAVELHGDFTLNGTSGAFLNITGSLTEIGYISAAAARDDDTITLSSVSGLARDDLIILWNSAPSSYSPHRSVYYDGEFARVEAVAGSNVQLQSNLLTSYTGVSTDKVFKSSAIAVVINGPAFVSDGVYSVRIQYAANVIVQAKDIRTSGSVAALVLNKCYNVLVEDGRYYKPYSGSGGSGTDYGISVSNSQYVTIRNVDAYGGRHAVTTGGDGSDGAVPCRFIDVQDSLLTNDPASNIYNADFHGNTLDSYYTNCVIYGAIGLAGENVGCVDSQVHTWPDDVYGPLRMHEVVGGQILFKNNRVRVGDGSTSFWIIGGVSSTISANISKPYQVIVDGLDAGINANITTLFNTFENSGQPNAWVLNEFGFRGNASGLVDLLRYTKSGSGIDASYIKIQNPKFDATNYQLFYKNTALPNALIYWPYLVGDAPPVANVWYQGALIYDRTPSASGFMGWVCVADGVPGTWKTFGPISV